MNDPVLGVITLATLCASLVICITVHEFSHAYAATELGDWTARGLGRLSLNPLRHLDPVGTALIFFAGFGWGKPVPVNARYLRVGERPGMALVALAGPASNIVAAVLFAIPLRVGVADTALGGASVFGAGSGGVLGYAGYALTSLVFWNLILATFNLLPIAPLDGFKVALGLLPRSLAVPFARLEPYGPGILLLIIALGFFSPNLRILSGILRPMVNLLGQIILGRPLL